MQQIYGFLFLVLGICFIGTHSLKAQSSIRINENFDGVPLLEVFDILKKNYQVKFSFQHKAVEQISINEKIDGLPLDHTLDILLTEANLVYKILENREVLVRRAPANENRRMIGIKGQVLDANSKEALAFAPILYGTAKGTETDENGFFSLEFKSRHLPESLEVQYLGYEPQILILDASAPLNRLQIFLQPKRNEFDPVTITEQEPVLKRQDKDTGRSSANIQKLNTLPAFVGGDDPFRNLQMLPGIVASDDLSAELKVRGGDGDENVVVLDGIPLFNVSHYFGIFSLINPSIVEEIRIYKNIFPIEYGGRISSVVDIHTIDLEKEKVSGSAEVNLLTTNGHLELPIGSKLDLMMGGRITNKNVANTDIFNLLDQNTRRTTSEEDVQGNVVNSDLFGLDPNFRFNDFNAKLNWQIAASTMAQLSFFSGLDQFDYTLERIFDRPIIPDDIFTFTETSKWENLGASLQLQHQWSDAFTSEISLAQSSYRTDATLNSAYSNYNVEQRRYRTIEIEQLNENSISGLELNQKNEWSISDNQSLQFGMHFSDHETLAKIEIEDTTLLNVDNAGRQLALFAEYRQLIADKFQFSLGLRPTYFQPLEQVYWSPRLGINFAPTAQFYFKGSWSKYYQFLRRSFHENRLGRSYDFWALPDGDRFPVATAQNLMLGWNWHNELFELDVEFYQKDLEGVIEHALVINGFDEAAGGPSRSRDYRIFKGEGKTIGMDLLLRKTSGAYTGWLAYTLSKSTQWFEMINGGIPFPSPEDRRHQLKWINQYRHKRWTFSLSYIFSSGQPFTDLSVLVVNPQDRRLVNPNQRISYLDDYHRVDLGCNYNFPISKARGELGFSLFNVFNRNNVKYRQYVYALRPQLNGNTNIRLIGTELQMLGITPNLSFKISFGDQ